MTDWIAGMKWKLLNKNTILLAAAYFAVVLIFHLFSLQESGPVPSVTAGAFGKMKAKRDYGGILAVAMKEGPRSEIEMAKGILIKSGYSDSGKFYSAGLSVLFSYRQMYEFIKSFLLFWLLFLGLRFLAWHDQYHKPAEFIRTHVDSDPDLEWLVGIVASKPGVLIISFFTVFIIQYFYFMPQSIHLDGYDPLKPILFSGIWLGMIPLYIFMILPGMTPSGFFCGAIALLAAGSVHFMGIYSSTSAYAGMVFAGVTPFLLFSLLFLATFLIAPISPRSKWRRAKTDGRRYLCANCYRRFDLGPGLPRFVRTFGRMFAREIPMEHKDFRDYFKCRKCGSRQKIGDVRFVTAVIDGPWPQWHEEKEYKAGGIHLLVNVTAHERKIIDIDADALEIRNAPGLDYDFLIQDFYLGLTKDPFPKAKIEAGKFPAILVDDPPLSPNIKRLMDEWFETVASGQPRLPGSGSSKLVDGIE